MPFFFPLFFFQKFLFCVCFKISMTNSIDIFFSLNFWYCPISFGLLSNSLSLFLIYGVASYCSFLIAAFKAMGFSVFSVLALKFRWFLEVLTYSILKNHSWFISDFLCFIFDPWVFYRIYFNSCLLKLIFNCITFGGCFVWHCFFRLVDICSIAHA